MRVVVGIFSSFRFQGRRRASILSVHLLRDSIHLDLFWVTSFVVLCLLHLTAASFLAVLLFASSAVLNLEKVQVLVGDRQLPLPGLKVGYSGHSSP